MVKRLFFMFIFAALFCSACETQWNYYEPRARMLNGSVVIDNLWDGYYMLHFCYVNSVPELPDLIISFKKTGNVVEVLDVRQFTKPAAIDSTVNASNIGLLDVGGGLIISVFSADLRLDIWYGQSTQYENILFSKIPELEFNKEGGYWRINGLSKYVSTSSNPGSIDYITNAWTYYIEKELISVPAEAESFEPESSPASP